MKRIRLSRGVVGMAMITGIVLGIVLDVWYQKGSAPVVYASGQEVVLLEKTVLIGTSITWSEERIKKEIRTVFPENPELMIKVAWCESRLLPDAQGPTDDHGIFQLHNPSHNLDGIDVYDPAENIRFARTLYDEYGLIPWKASAPCWMN